MQSLVHSVNKKLVNTKKQFPNSHLIKKISTKSVSSQIVLLGECQTNLCQNSEQDVSKRRYSKTYLAVFKILVCSENSASTENCIYHSVQFQSVYRLLDS